jgi:predicted nicotinamide N-methyase
MNTIEEYHVFLNGDTNEYIFPSLNDLQVWVAGQTVPGYIEKHIITIQQHDTFGIVAGSALSAAIATATAAAMTAATATPASTVATGAPTAPLAPMAPAPTFTNTQKVQVVVTQNTGGV